MVIGEFPLPLLWAKMSKAVTQQCHAQLLLFAGDRPMINPQTISSLDMSQCAPEPNSDSALGSQSQNDAVVPSSSGVRKFAAKAKQADKVITYLQESVSFFTPLFLGAN